MRDLIRRGWPWAVVAALTLPAVYHVVHVPDDVDPEFPKVIQPTFSAAPPPSYRLAEPGDTIDRVSIYVSAAATVLAAVGIGLSSRARRPVGPWASALGLALAGLWHAATPGPTFDGWHGWGFRALLDPSTSAVERSAIGAGTIALIALVVAPMTRARRVALPGRPDLLVGALILVALRQFEIPGVEPVGYWPRWSLAWGISTFGLALLIAQPPYPRSWLARAALGLGMVGGWLGLTLEAIDVSWIHRPLERMRVVEPGRIFISAMPSYRGLKIAQGRHHFKTIINLFPEDTAQRSSRWPQELRFVKESGVRYLRSPNGAHESDAFLDETLRVARDPAAWPVLVHCHGCMDRTPAWMGIYRFTVQGRSLADIMTEIERHRGYRPKASVTLLYNRVLAERAPEHYRADPTAALLRKCAAGTEDPYYDDRRREALRAESTGPTGLRR